MKNDKFPSKRGGVNVKGRITYIGIKASLETRFEEATVDKVAPEDDTEKISLTF